MTPPAISTAELPLKQGATNQWNNHWNIDHVTSANGYGFTSSALWLMVHSTHGAVLLLDLHPTAKTLW